MDWWQKLKEWFRANPPPADWLTAGPAEDEHPLVRGPEVIKAGWGAGSPTGLEDWANGFYRPATRVDAHVGRIGGVIVPRTVVVHTTDCLPGTAPVIIKSWATTPGKGNGAHFVIGRGGEVTQLVSVTRNGQHAGGPTHGWYVLDNAVNRLVHPNAWAVGIELDCAGKLVPPRTPGGNPVHRDSGREIPRGECAQYTDGTWWHLTTNGQMVVLRRLLDSLVANVLQPEPKSTIVNPSGSAPLARYAGRTSYGANGVPWAVHGGQVMGHVTLDPVNKTDPGPFVMRAVTEWGH